MAQDATSAENAYVALKHPVGGAWIDISDKCSDARMPFTKADIDTSSFGQGDATNVAGLRDGTFTLQAFNDPVLDELAFAIYMSKDPVEGRYAQFGNESGLPMYEASFNMTGYEPGGSVNTANTAPLSFHRTGGTQRTIIA